MYVFVAETHPDRAADIERTVCELSLAQTWRAEYVARHAGPTASKKQRIRALARTDPEVSDAAYRLLDLRLSFLEKDDLENFVGTDREAALLNRSVASIERASLPLEGRYQTSRRRRNLTTVRIFNVSEQVHEFARELLNLLQTAKVRLLETAKVRVDDTNDPELWRQTADLQSRNRKSAHLVSYSKTTTTGQAASAKIEGLADTLIKACGEALADPVRYSDLWMPHEPQGWLNAGCDLELDILPTLRKLSQRELAKGKQRSIKTWRFFRDAVFDARDARLALKTPSASKGKAASSPKQVPRVSQFESPERRAERERKESVLSLQRRCLGRKPAVAAEDGAIGGQS